MTNEKLKSAYLEILKEIDTKYLGHPANRPGGLNGLSGLFLPSVSANYSQADNKVMIIGCETRKWEPLGNGDFQSVDAYVDRAMKTHQEFFEKELVKDDDKGRSFHNFTRAISRIESIDVNGLIYANLFCFSWGKKKGSPIKLKDKDLFASIRKWSRKILDTQIEILQPDYIVFANGIASAPYRREFFPHHGDAGRCTSSKSYPEKIAKEYLWEFMLDKKIRCFRVQHPSARSKEADNGRKFVFELLADAVSKRPVAGAAELEVQLDL